MSAGDGGRDTPYEREIVGREREETLAKNRS